MEEYFDVSYIWILFNLCKLLPKKWVSFIVTLTIEAYICDVLLDIIIQIITYLLYILLMSRSFSLKPKCNFLGDFDYSLIVMAS